METYITESPEETEKLGFALAKKLKGGETIAYRGGLGAGKTCFTRGVAALIQMSELSVCAPSGFFGSHTIRTFTLRL